MTTTLRLINFRCPPELDAAMQTVAARDGITASAQIRLALTAWLTDRGALSRRQPIAPVRPGRPKATDSHQPQHQPRRRR